MSYFPNPNTTVLGLVQHSQLINIENSLIQQFTALGGGAKFQLTTALKSCFKPTLYGEEYRSWANV